MSIRDRVKDFRRVRAGDLVAHPQNYREHPPAQRAALQAVLEEVGFAGAVLAREDDKGRLILIDGHLRVDLHTDEEIPVLVLDVDENEAGVLLATFDPMGAMAERNTAKMRKLVEGLKVKGDDTRALLERLSRPTGPRKRQVDLDSLPDAPAVPTTQPGDVWTLGEHRLVCGNCFDAPTLAALLEGEKVPMVLTDPPYAIYGVASDIADDGMVVPFFESMFRAIQDHAEWFAHAYVHCDWRSWAAIWEAAKRAQMTPKNCIVWDKQSAGLGSSYANTHEFVGLFAKLPPEAAVMTVKRVGQRQVHRPNLIRADRVRGDDREHNAAKPVSLLSEFIQNSSDPGDVVLDMFAGSGSTLMAADDLDRRGRLVEKSPKWCDVIVARWERVTEGKAERIPAPAPSS